MTDWNYATLAAICSELDRRANRNRDSIKEIIEAAGVSEDVAVRVSEQRALRAYLHLHGREDEIHTDQPKQIQVPRQDRREMVTIQSAWLDGFMVGLSLANEEVRGFPPTEPDGRHRRGGR